MGTGGSGNGWWGGLCRCGLVVAIADVDCTEAGGFDEVDEEGLGELPELLGEEL